MAKQIAEQVAEETTSEVVEKVAEVAEQSIEAVEHVVEKVVTVTRNNPLVLGAALLAGVGLGALVAHRLTTKKLQADYDARLEDELAVSREFFARTAKKDEYETPEKAAQALIPEEVNRTIKAYKGERVPYNKPDEIKSPPETVVVEETNITTVNVFEDPDVIRDTGKLQWNEEDYKLEISDREINPGAPYVISYEEFAENGELVHDKIRRTYYSEDDTLVDEREQPVDDIERHVGSDNLRRFGHGSHDPGVVYVRNERISTDFEISHDGRAYSTHVLGLEPPENIIKHSRDRRAGRRTFREE